MIGYIVFGLAVCSSIGVLVYIANSFKKFGKTVEENDGLIKTLREVANAKKARDYLHLNSISDAARLLRKKYTRD